MLQLMNNGIELKYNGGAVHVHRLSWILPLEELPGARILAELDNDAEILIKAMFRVVVRVNSDDYGDDDDGDTMIGPQLGDSYFSPFFANYPPSAST